MKYICASCEKPFESKRPGRVYCSIHCHKHRFIAYPEKAAAEFWSKVDKNAPNGCWVWTGYCQKFGHGWLGSERGLAHT